MDARFEIEGKYIFRKYNKEGKLLQELGPFNNKITNIGLNRVGTDRAITYCYVGTGTSPSAFTDTQMQTLVGSSGSYTSANSNSNVTPYWAQQSFTFRFDPGQATGNLTEVGIGWGSNSISSLFSRELIVDSSGNPISLTVLADEYLDVTYVLRFYPKLDDFSGSFVIGTTTYNYTGRAAFVTSCAVNGVQTAPFITIRQVFGGASCSLGPVTDTIQNASSVLSPSPTNTVAPYVTNSFERQGVALLDLNSGNLAGGIRAIDFVPAGGAGLIYYFLQILLDQPIPKDNTKTLSLTLKNSWGRYTP